VFAGMSVAFALVAAQTIAGPEVRLDPEAPLQERRADRFELNCDFVVENGTHETWRLAEIQLVARDALPSSFGGFSKAAGSRSITAARRPLDTGEILEVR
jgi:hypothetical protein